MRRERAPGRAGPGSAAEVVAEGPPEGGVADVAAGVGPAAVAGGMLRGPGLGCGCVPAFGPVQVSGSRWSRGAEPNHGSVPARRPGSGWNALPGWVVVLGRG